VKQHAREVEVSPTTTTVTVVARARQTTHGAAALPPHRSNIGNEAGLVEIDIEDTGPFQTQQGTE
jgi:hypothetical protein